MQSENLQLSDLASLIREGKLADASIQDDASESDGAKTDMSFLLELDSAFRSRFPDEFAPTVPGYMIQEQIGQGGMGVVFRAKQESLNRDVALKLISPDQMDRQKYRERFENEALAASRLFHPNIVSAFDYGIWNDVPWIAMKYIQGIDLEKALLLGAVKDLINEQDPQMYWQKIAKLGAEVADALQTAHDANIYHRDIKPSNLILDKQGKAWITDFGLAKSSLANCSVSITGEVIGTPNYIAPEQVRGRVDARTDVFSLGITLYELLVGTAVPWDELAEEQEKGELSDVRTRNPDIPESLAAIVMKACAFHPEDRIQSAHELSSLLARFADGEAKVERRQTRRDHAARPYLRKRFFAVALIAAAVVGGLVQSWTNQEAQSDSTSRTEVQSVLASPTHNQSTQEIKPLKSISLSRANQSLLGGSDGSTKLAGTSYGSVRDGDLSTYWSPENATGRVSIKWHSPRTVDSVKVLEAVGSEGNVGKWALVDVDKAKTITSGSGACAVSFEPVTLRKINFVILSSKATPRIAEFQTFGPVE